MKFKSFLIVALASAATGAVLGILFAPDRGDRTRRRISRRSAQYVDAVMDKANEFIEEATSKTAQLKEEVTDLAKKGKDALNTLTS